MSDDKLDEMERQAIKMIEFFKEDCRRQCAPYVKIISDIRSIRPHTYFVDDQLMVPILPLPADPPNECPGCGKQYPIECDWCSDDIREPPNDGLAVQTGDMEK